MNQSAVENAIGEQLLAGHLPHGLPFVLNPRPDFSRTMAVLATHYGSLDSRVPGERQQLTPVPDGIAHFLEHKLFEDQHGDVSLRFSSRGASCNAGTEFSKTSYHFTCADQVEENLETLIRFVFDPWFTDQSVAKEQGIIAQEIRMYDDDPDWVVFFNLLESLYHSHPVRINIAGTVESIRKITPALLYTCHRAFYHPANMVLVVAGGFDPARVREVAERTMASLRFDPGRAWQRPRIDEPPSVFRKRVTKEFAVSRPQLALGFKDVVAPRSPQEWLRRDLESRLMLDVLFSSSSPHHERLYERGLIDDTFGASYSGEDDFGFTILGGETDEPDRLADELLEVVRKAARDGVGPDDFELARNRFLGRYVRAFNSVEALANALVACHFRGVNLDEVLRTASTVTPADLERRLREHLREELSAVSILTPQRDGGPAKDAAGRG